MRPPVTAQVVNGRRDNGQTDLLVQITDGTGLAVWTAHFNRAELQQIMAGLRLKDVLSVSPGSGWNLIAHCRDLATANRLKDDLAQTAQGLVDDIQNSRRGS